MSRVLKPLALSLVLALAALPARAQPPVWVVRDADSTIVIFGSVHLLPPGLDWRPAALDAALKEADDLWFELPIDGGSSREAAQLAVARGILPPGETLSSKLSRRGRARLTEIAARLNLPMASLERMRPWLADLTLGVAQLAAGGANGSDGVERTLSLSAPATAQRRAFETPEQQIAFFADASDNEQVKALEHSLREMQDQPRTSGQMIDAWLAGDLKALKRRGLNPMRRNSPGLYRRLVTERNARWTQMLTERLAGSGETVVVVGAAHLIGKDGLPAMLRARGIAVEGP